MSDKNTNYKVIGRDKNNNELHIGDYCKYKMDFENKGFREYSGSYEFIGRINYSPDDFGFCFDNIEARKVEDLYDKQGKVVIYGYVHNKNLPDLVDFAPCFLMGIAEYNSIEKCDYVREKNNNYSTKVEDILNDDMEDIDLDLD